MRDDRGWYVVTYRVPGEKRAKTRRLRSRLEVAKVSATYPVGTQIWVMVPGLNIGYGMTVRENKMIY